MCPSWTHSKIYINSYNKVSLILTTTLGGMFLRGANGLIASECSSSCSYGKDKKRTVIPTPHSGQDITFTAKKVFFKYFVEITIKVKQGQKKLISLNEQRDFVKGIGKTFY